MSRAAAAPADPMRLVTAGVIVSLLCLLTPAGARGAFKYVEAGMAAPEFTLAAGDGREITPGEIKSHPATLLLFWATWSPRSEQALLDVQALYEEYGGKGLAAFAVNLDRPLAGLQEKARIEETVRRLALSVPVVFDPGFAASGAFGVVANPSVALIDGDGRLAWDVSGYYKDTASACREQVEIALGIRPPPQPAGGEAPERRPPDQKAALLFNLGRSLLRQGQRSKALDTLGSAAAADAGFAAPQVLLGHLLLQDETVSSAEKSEALFRAAIAADAGSVSARAGLGEALLRQGRLDEAQEELARALAADRSFTPALAAAAALGGIQGREEEAEALFREALELNPRDPVVLARRGESRARSGNLAAAAEDYRRSVEILLDLP